MLCLWCNENSQDKDGDAGNVLHFRSSQTQDCEFGVARSKQKKLKRSRLAILDLKMGDKRFMMWGK
jgi:hypothetical protein